MAGPIIRLKDLMIHTGLSRSAIYDRMDKNSPRYAKDFPRSFRLSGGAVGWFKSEVDAWLETCATNAKKGKPAKNVKPFPSLNNLAVQAPSTSELPGSSKPVQNARQRPVSAPKKPTFELASKRMFRPGNLAEAIVEGGKITDHLLYYLQLKTWTPTMSALLISGIDPPQNCIEIPLCGIGLDGAPLHASNTRFHQARRILRKWHEWNDEQEDQCLAVEPNCFFSWCMNDDIDTEWLRLFLELIGFYDPEMIDLTSARFALLTGRQITNTTQGAAYTQSDIPTTEKKSAKRKNKRDELT